MSAKKKNLKLDASEYLNASFIRSLIFDHPEALIEDLKRTKNSLDSVLSAFELIAKNILKNKQKSKSINFAAEQVLIQAENIRKTKDPKTAAISMMILTFSLVHAEASEMLFDGAKLRSSRIHKEKFKGLLGVLGAINHFLNEDETLTAKQLWDWRFKSRLNNNHPDFDFGLILRDVDTGSTYEIYFDENKNKIVQHERKKSGASAKPRLIKWETFRKYVPMAKKMKN